MRRAGAALVERDPLLLALRHRLARAEQGRRGTVLICGSAGLGKTALVDAFLFELLSQPNVWVARGDCVEHYGAGEAYLPVLDALGRLGRLVGAPLVSILERHAPLWLQQLPGLTDVASQAALSARLSHAAPTRMLRELTEALEVLTCEHTLVLSLEDLHWCDPSTCSLLMFVARRIEPARLLILGTLRPDEAPEHVKNLVRELRARGWGKELTVPPLTEQGVRDYLCARLAPGVPGDALVGRLHARTGGNALFVVECLDALLEEGVLRRDGERWVLHDDGVGRADPLPLSLEGLALKRIAALPREQRALLEVASVAGHEFAVAELTYVLGLEADAVEQLCAELARDAALITSVGLSTRPDGSFSASYRFAHALFHQAVYQGLDVARRARLHRQIGEQLERDFGERRGEIATALRRHFEAGRDPVRALVYAQQAAQLAIARNAPHETIEHLTAALALWRAAGEDPASELSLRSMLGPQLIAARGWTAPEVLENYTRAHALCLELDDREQLPVVLRGLSAYHQVQGELGIARFYADTLLDHCGTGACAARVQAHASQIGALVAQADYVRALHHASEALRHYRREDSREHARRFGGLDPAVSSLAWAALALWSLGFSEASAHLAELTLEVGERLDHPFSAAFARHMAAVVWQRLGREREAHALFERAQQLAERSGYPFLSALSRASVVAARASSEQSVADMRALVAAHEQSGVRFALPDMLALLAKVEARTGDLEAARHTVERAAALAEATGQSSHLPALCIQQAELAREGEPLEGERASALLARAQELARGQHALAWELRAATQRAELLRAQGEPSAAGALLLEVYGAFDEGFDGAELERAGRLLHELTGSLPRPGPSARRGLVAEALEGLKERALALRDELLAEGGHSASSRPLRSESPSPSQRVLMLDESGLSRVAAEAEPGQRLVREGEYWTITYAARLCRVKDARGIGYLAQLMAAPHRELHVLDLSAEPVPEDAPTEDAPALSRALARAGATEALDEQARAAYRARASELVADIAEAREHADLGRLEALEHERDMLERELSRAFGLGGRPRANGAPSERARINVTRAIKSAIRRIAEHHPELGRHLSEAIRTGTFCTYSPDPTRASEWYVAALGAE